MAAKSHGRQACTWCARPETSLNVRPTLSSLMDAAERSDSSAADTLFAALYSELHRLAKRELAHKGFAVSLGPTTLLHQAYIEMAARNGVSFPDQSRFMGYAARAMRGLIIDHARRRRAQKRGGQFEITSADTDLENAVDDRELGKIGEALDDLCKKPSATTESLKESAPAAWA